MNCTHCGAPIVQPGGHCTTCGRPAGPQPMWADANAPSGLFPPPAPEQRQVAPTASTVPSGYDKEPSNAPAGYDQQYATPPPYNQPYAAPATNQQYAAPTSNEQYSAPPVYLPPTAYTAPPPYQPFPGYAPTAKPTGNALSIVAFVLVAISLLIAPVLFGTGAIVSAAFGMRRGERLARVALVLGIIAAVLGVLLAAVRVANVF